MSYLICLNKRDKLVVLFLCFFIFVTFVYAQENVLNLILIKDGNGITVADKTVSTSKTESQSNNLSGYKFVIRSFEDETIETINFGFKNNVAILSIRANQNFVKGEIYDDKDILLLTINNLFKHINLGLCWDGICSGDESYESCPQDCFLKKETLPLMQDNIKENKLLFVILYSAIGVIVFLIIFFSIIFLNKRIKPKEKFMQHKEELQYRPMEIEQQLKDYIRNAKKSGQNEDEIRQSLVNSNWPEELIDKYL